MQIIMKCNRKNRSKRLAQQGITLIEALISLLILALGVLGMVVGQARMLVETRTTNSRATAIRLIADLSERIRMNAIGAQPPASGGLSPYSDPQAGDFLPAQATAPCDPTSTATCPAAALDVWAWRQEVASSLMNGRASIWQVSPQQLQVVVAWQLNENANTTLTATSADQQLAAPLQITTGNGSTATSNLCPDNAICHVDFIDIPPV